MAGGFASVNPVDMLNTVSNIDQQNYNRAIDVGQRRKAWLDEQAQVAQNATGQLEMMFDNAYMEKARKDVETAAAAENKKLSRDALETLAEQRYNSMTEEERAATVHEYMDKNFESVKKVYDDLLKNNPHMGGAWKQMLNSDHREFVGLERIKNEDGTVSFGMRVKNNKTGTTGLLDPTAEGAVTADGEVQPLKINGYQLAGTLYKLGEAAVMSRGDRTASTASTLKSQADDINNRSVDEKEALALAQNKGISEGAAANLREASKAVVPTAALLTSPGAGGGGGGKVGLNVQYDPKTVVADATPSKTPTKKPEETGVKTTSLADVVGQVTGPVAKGGTGMFGAGGPLNPVRLFNEIRERRTAAQNDPETAAKNIDAFVGKLNAAHKEGGGELGFFNTQVFDELTDLARSNKNYTPAALAKRGLAPQLVAEIEKRIGPPSQERGAAFAAELTPETQMAIDAYRNGTGSFAAVEATLPKTLTFNKNYSPAQIKKMLDGETKIALGGERRTKLTPRESFAYGLATAAGWVDQTKDIDAAQTAGKDAMTEVAKDVGALTRNSTPGSAVNVDTSVLNQQLQIRAADARAAREARAALDDKTLDNYGKMIGDLTAGMDDASKQEFANIVYASGGIMARAGFHPGTSQMNAAFLGSLASLTLRARRNDPSTLAQWFRGEREFNDETVGTILKEVTPVTFPRGSVEYNQIATDVINRNKAAGKQTTQGDIDRAVEATSKFYTLQILKEHRAKFGGTITERAQNQ